MGKDYTISNYYSYDASKINIRQLVLLKLKNYCMHLRDYTIDYLGYNDPSKWLINTKEIEDNIAHWEDQAKKYKAEFEELMKDESKLRDMYQRQVVSVHETYMNAEHSYHHDHAKKVEECCQVLLPLVASFAKKDSNPLMTKIIEELDDVVETCTAEYSKDLEDDKTSVSAMRNHAMMSFEDFRKETIERQQSWYDHAHDHAASCRRNLKDALAKNKNILEIFKAIEDVEAEV